MHICVCVNIWANFFVCIFMCVCIVCVYVCVYVCYQHIVNISTIQKPFSAGRTHWQCVWLSDLEPEYHKCNSEKCEARTEYGCLCMCVCVTSVVMEWLNMALILVSTHTRTHAHTYDVILWLINGMCKWEGLCLCVLPIANTHACTHMRLL